MRASEFPSSRQISYLRNYFYTSSALIIRKRLSLMRGHAIKKLYRKLRFRFLVSQVWKHSAQNIKTGFARFYVPHIYLLPVNKTFYAADMD